MSNEQVSDLVSRSILGQLNEYRRRMEIIFDSWSKNPSFALEPTLFPDFVFVALIDVTNKTVFEWNGAELLAERGVTLDMLLAARKREDLSDEIRALHTDKDRWLTFNSSVKATFPTFTIGTTFSNEATLDRRYVVIAEVLSDRLYSNVKSRRGQELALIDSHQNLLLSTKQGWDPSNLNFNDRVVNKILDELPDDKDFFEVLRYPDRAPQATSIYRLPEGGGLTLVLQEPESNLHESAESLQWQSIMIVLIVLVVMLNLLVFFANSIISPLAQLTTMMERVGKGEFGGKIKVKTKDEIGRLANVFNRMITDLKNREEEIERAKSRLVQSEKMSAFGQMSAGIAHEVKNPLAGILGYAQMSKKKLPADSEVLPYMDIIEKETVRCKEIVENLMRFARQEKAVMSRIDINKTIKDSIRLVEHQMSISGIKVSQIFALDGAPIWTSGNANQIQQVMMNLMLNAQQAMDNKGTLTVSTHFEPDQNRIMILVNDTGAGMPPDVRDRVFEPFFTTKGVGKGTGLGLSVSLGIIKDHGGTIEVESQVGKGTTFTITLPCGDQAAQGQDGSVVAA